MQQLPPTAGRFILHFARPYGRKFAWFFLLSGAGIACFIATPFVISNLIDHLIAHRTIDTTIWWFIGIFALLHFMDEWLWRGAELLVRSFLPQLFEAVRSGLFEQTLQKTHRFFVNANSGQVGYWINGATEMVDTIIETIIWSLWNRFFSIAIAMTLLAIASWKLAVIFTVWLVVLIIVLVYRGRRYSAQVASTSDASSEVAGQVVDTVANNVPVRVFAARSQELHYLSEGQHTHINLWRASWWYAACTNMIKGNSAALVSAVALIVAVHLYAQGEASIGDIALFITYITSIGETIWDLSAQLDTYIRSYGKLTNALTNLLPPDAERQDGAVLQAKSLSVEFSHLSFAYPDQPDTFVLQDVDFAVAPGERVGIVGHSGAGKSTIVGLLLGLYAPTGGQLRYNGKDITGLSLQSVREHCVLVPQDTSLFNRTVAANITYGSARKVSGGELRAAAGQAKALDFIESLPNGFSTLVGERGVKLSGGQRQRIAITRAMLSRAPLIVLDEATSALDSVSEQYIQASLAAVMKNRTAIVIAHRLSTLKHLDRIVVLDAGKVAESGTHEQLLAQKGIYADLWRRQKDGFIGE